VDGRLVRLVRGQGEYLIFALMLAGLKNLASLIYHHRQHKLFRSGFDNAFLMRNIERFPTTIWPKERQKRAYFSSVLGRAEVNSSYQPARKLWLRTRNGCYMPNPGLRLRVLGADGEAEWQPIYQVLRLDVIQSGDGFLWGGFDYTYQNMMQQAGMRPLTVPGQKPDTLMID